MRRHQDRKPLPDNTPLAVKETQQSKKSQRRSYLYETGRLLRLAWPILIAQIALTAMGFIDTIMAGDVSPLDLAAVAVGNSIWVPVVVSMSGLMMGMAAMVAQKSGARQTDRIPSLIQQTIWISIGLSVVVVLIMQNAHRLLEMMGTETALSNLAAHYLIALSFSTPAFFGFQILRHWSEGLGQTKPAMYISFIALMINIPANYIFIYGKLGLPALGGAGCGYASALVYWISLVLMLFYTRRHPVLRKHALFQKIYKPNLPQLKRIISIGGPISLSLFCEISLFSAVALLLAPLGTLIIAGHQVAHSYAALIFMLPLSMSLAVTIRVGQCVGEKRFDQARIATLSALGVGTLIAATVAYFTYTFRNAIPLLYTEDKQVIELASALLVLSAIYQISDAIQTIASGALRGYTDTRVIFFITMISFWPFGLTIGYLLGSTDLLVMRMGPQGYWIGFISGLSCAGLLFSLRLRHQFRRYQLKPSI